MLVCRLMLLEQTLSLEVMGDQWKYGQEDVVSQIKECGSFLIDSGGWGTENLSGN